METILKREGTIRYILMYAFLVLVILNMGLCKICYIAESLTEDFFINFAKGKYANFLLYLLEIAVHQLGAPHKDCLLHPKEYNYYTHISSFAVVVPCYV